MADSRGRSPTGGAAFRRGDLSPDDELEQLLYAEEVRRPGPESDCSDEVCKALAGLGFAGLADEVGLDGDDIGTVGDLYEGLRDAWRRKLAQEGKRPGRQSLGDLVGGS